jgi:Ca-activated chloride channel family protein
MTLWPTGLQWTYPWAWGLAALPLMLWLARSRVGGRMRQDALAYADAQLHPWAVRLVAPRVSAWRGTGELLLGMLLAASLAGPRLPLASSAAGLPSTRHAVNVMVVLDASPGMAQVNAQGLSRMEHARMVLQDLLPRLHGERLGLAIYGQGAGVLLPCTDDMAIFDHALQQASPALLQAQHSAGLPGALELARRELLATPGASRAVLLVAGADPARHSSMALQLRLEQQAASLRAAGIPVFVLMLEHATWFGESTSALDSKALADLAHATAGATSQLGSDPWGALYTRGLARLPSNPAPAGEVIAWRELYGAPLLGALLLMLLLSLPSAQYAMRDSQTDMRGDGGLYGRLRVSLNTRRRGRTRLPVALILASALGLSMLFMAPQPAQAQTTASAAKQAWDAWTAWRDGRFAQAWQLYAALPGFDARMGEGGSAYRLGAYSQALAAYRRAMLDANTDAQRAQALYNLGNAAFHLPGALRESLDAYNASLALGPGNAAVLRNLHLAEAQWTFEHPEAAYTFMLKHSLAQPPSFFGRGNKRPPSQMSPARQQSAPMAAANQVLESGGRLQAGAVERAARPAPPTQLTQAERQAAQRKMALLDDHAVQLLGNLLERDNAEALKGAAAAPPGLNAGAGVRP